MIRKWVGRLLKQIFAAFVKWISAQHTPIAPTLFGVVARLQPAYDFLPRFQVLAELPDEVIEGPRAMIVENFGQEVLYVITNEGLTPQINIPVLRFHDRLDNVTPVEDSRAIARVWEILVWSKQMDWGTEVLYNRK